MGDIRTTTLGGIPFGDNAGRPANATVGQPYFNGQSQRLELYTGNSYGWQNIVAETPGVTGYTGTIIETNTTNTITITGTNFSAGATASLIGTDGTEYVATSTTINNLTSATVVFGAISASLEPYDIKVTNPSNLYGVYYDILTVNDKPIWQTAAGSLGIFNEQTAITTSVLAVSDEENNTITYSLASGSSLPEGLTLNSSNGVISGTLPSISADTTYTFTINASDGINAPQPRVFSILSKDALTFDYLLIAGGGAGGASYAGGGGAGGLLSGNKLFRKSTLLSVSIGQGGTAAAQDSGLRGGNGENSVLDNLIAIGGGGGGSYSTASQNTGGAGGSGGGSAREEGGAGGSGTSGQGNAGGAMSSNSSGSVYRGGGGGGAGGTGYAGDNLGSLSGQGGIGIQSSITGTSTYYAGGGGGGVYNSTSDNGAAGLGGLGGGGNGLKGGGTASAGTPNTGGGGGGAGGVGSGQTGGLKGGNGGSGVLIVAYPNTEPALTIAGGLTYDQPTRSGYRVYRFTSGTGTITF